MKDIKYILWDVDRTLIDFDYAEKEALKKCYTQYGFVKSLVQASKESSRCPSPHRTNR